MVRIGLVWLSAALAASAVCAQQVYRHVLPDGRVVYNDTPPGLTAATPAQPEWSSTAPAAQDARVGISDSARAPESARPSDDFGAGARLVVPPQEVKR